MAIGADHRSSLIRLLAAYDEADNLKRVTTGEDLAHWEIQFEDADEQIREIVDDIDAIEIARHVLFSPAF